MLTKNLTPNPFPTREGEQENRGFKASLRVGERFGEGYEQENRGFKASLRVGERFGEGYHVYFPTFQTSSNASYANLTNQNIHERN